MYQRWFLQPLINARHLQKLSCSANNHAILENLAGIALKLEGIVCEMRKMVYKPNHKNLNHRMHGYAFDQTCHKFSTKKHCVFLCCTRLSRSFEHLDPILTLHSSWPCLGKSGGWDWLSQGPIHSVPWKSKHNATNTISSTDPWRQVWSRAQEKNQGIHTNRKLHQPLKIRKKIIFKYEESTGGVERRFPVENRGDYQRVEKMTLRLVSSTLTKYPVSYHWKTVSHIICHI